MSVSPAGSAIVRPIFKIRLKARADNPSLSIAASSRLDDVSSIRQCFLICRLLIWVLQCNITLSVIPPYFKDNKPSLNKLGLIQKPYYRTGNACKGLELKPDTLRYRLRHGHYFEVEKINGKRRFSTNEIKALCEIQFRDSQKTQKAIPLLWGFFIHKKWKPCSNYKEKSGWTAGRSSEKSKRWHGAIGLSQVMGYGISAQVQKRNDRNHSK